MDFISVFFASILFGFFASSYSLKYEASVSLLDAHLKEFVPMAMIGEIILLFSVLVNNDFFKLLGLVLLGVIIVFQIYVSVCNINRLNKNKAELSNFKCVLIGLKNIFMVMGALLIGIQYLIELILNLLLYNKYEE